MNKKILAIILIISAISGALYGWLDNDPDTNPDVMGVIEKVKEGIDSLRKDDVPAEQSLPSID